MAVAHPTAGAFGVYAGMYVSPFAGYAVRVSYWLMQVIATGGQLVAASIYMAYWFPAVPGALWVLALRSRSIYVNSRAVGTARHDRVLARDDQGGRRSSLFVGDRACWSFSGCSGEPAIGLGNLAARRVHAVRPVGRVARVLLRDLLVHRRRDRRRHVRRSRDPARTIPRAMRRMVLGLSAIYIVTITLLVALTPWSELGVGESPFVSVLRRLGIPGAAGRDELRGADRGAVERQRQPLSHHAHAVFAGPRRIRAGALGRGQPARRAGERAAGVGRRAGAAVLVRALWPDSAYVWFFGVALFGALFVWLMIFVTHIAFRARRCRATRSPARGRRGGRGDPAVHVVGAGSAVDTVAGGPWLLLLAIGYSLSRPRT